MPRFRAAGIEVQLCTTSLEQTCTTNPDDLAIGRGKKELEDIENRFASARHLPERIVRDGEDEGIVRFLGDVYKTPFFLVRTGHNSKSHGPSDVPRPIFDQSSSLNTGSVSCQSDEEALLITVDVSPLSMRPGRDGKPMDIKVDVFCNGVFCGYKLLNARYGSNKVFFAGHRLYTTFERPMVLRRPNAAGHASLSESERRKTCKERWQLINRALFQEAALRGLDKRNMPLPITEYLTSLATYGFPTALAEDTSPPLDVNMGIIDVVVSLGYGKKRTGDDKYSYLPTRMVDTLHHTEVPIKQEVLDSFSDVEAYPNTPVESVLSQVSSAGSFRTQGEISTESPQDSVIGNDEQEQVPRKPVKIKLRLRRNRKEDQPLTPIASNVATRTGPQKSSLSIPTTSASSRRKTPTENMEGSYAWPVPDLSEGSVATFATLEMLRERYAGTTGITPGMCRQVRKERSGEFTEDDVLMGVRFVVG